MSSAAPAEHEWKKEGTVVTGKTANQRNKTWFSDSFTAVDINKHCYGLTPPFILLCVVHVGHFICWCVNCDINRICRVLSIGLFFKLLVGGWVGRSASPASQYIAEWRNSSDLIIKHEIPLLCKNTNATFRSSPIINETSGSKLDILPV